MEISENFWHLLYNAYAQGRSIFPEIDNSYLKSSCFWFYFIIIIIAH